MPRPDADRELRAEVKKLFREAIEQNGKQCGFAATYQVSTTYISKILGGDEPLDVMWAERARIFIGREAARALEQQLARLFRADAAEHKPSAPCVATAAARYQYASARLTMKAVEAGADGEVCDVDRAELRDLSDEVDRRQEDLLGVAAVGC